MTLNILGTQFTSKEILKGATGAATVGIASASLISQNKTNRINNNLNKLQGRSTIRRDLADGHLTSEQAIEYCKQQGISPEECLNPPIYKSKPKQRGKNSTQLRGGGFSVDSSSDSNSYSLQHGTEHIVKPVKNDTFIGVDPNFSYGSTDNKSRLSSSLPLILSGVFLVGYFTFQWFRKNKSWVRDLFPNETELIIGNQIEMQRKLDKISALQEKINEKLLNEKTK